MALFSVLALSLTSCNEDEKPKAINITKLEIGHEGQAILGKDLRIECHIDAPAKIKAIDIEFLNIEGNRVYGMPFTSGKYVGVASVDFQEHIDIPAFIPEGRYKVFFNVIDEAGNIEKVAKMLNLYKISKDAPKIGKLTIKDSTGKDLKYAAPKDKVIVSAMLEVVNEISEIEMKFQGTNGKVEIALDKAVMTKYKGKTKGHFFETITIPADMKSGEYHFQFKVKDAKGIENMVGIDGFTIK